LKSHGIKNIILDSDGCVNSLIPIFVEGGITGILLMERAAGMDPEAVRKAYPKLQMIGGVDKLKIAKDGCCIDDELEKIAALIGRGGYCQWSIDGALFEKILWAELGESSSYNGHDEIDGSQFGDDDAGVLQSGGGLSSGRGGEGDPGVGGGGKG
jgi:hypothetical protein